MKKNNKSKLNAWKTNLNNRLYFFTSILILIILFVVVIYFTKQPIIVGKAFNVIYKDNTEGKFPLTITFTKDESTGALTKSAAFKDGAETKLLTFGNFINNQLKSINIEIICDVGAVCAKGYTGSGVTLYGVCQNDGSCSSCSSNIQCPNGYNCDNTGFCINEEEQQIPSPCEGLEIGTECNTGYLDGQGNNIFGTCQSDGSCKVCITEPNSCQQGYTCINNIFCIQTCGNGVCGEDENIDTCPEDCTAQPQENPLCQEGEICELGFTGGGVILYGVCNNVNGVSACENCITEPDNCPVGKICQTQGVLNICVDSCGNNLCEAEEGENSNNCPTDCLLSECNNNNICEQGEESLNCINDCTPSDLIVESIEYLNEENDQYVYQIIFKNNGQTDIFVPSTGSSDLYLRIMTYLYDETKTKLEEYENWLNSGLIEFKLKGGNTYTIYSYFDKTQIINPSEAHLQIILDINNVVVESEDGENNNFFWFNPFTSGEPTQTNKPFEPPSDLSPDLSWGSWQQGENEVTFSKVDYESESGNEYINNPFVSGYIIYVPLNQQNQMSLKDIQIVAIPNTVKEYYYEQQSNKILLKTYTCPKDRYLLPYTANINGADSTLNTYACYCTLDAQCGYGWTCDLTQGDGIITGKCVKNS